MTHTHVAALLKKALRMETDVESATILRGKAEYWSGLNFVRDVQRKEARDFFTGGVLLWISGRNAGIVRAVLASRENFGLISDPPLSSYPLQGDEYVILFSRHAMRSPLMSVAFRDASPT